MSGCVIVSVDVDHPCIEALFQVQGKWLRNRIHYPKSPDGRALNLSDAEQVTAYLQKYAWDNYASLADVPLVAAEDIGAALERLTNVDYAALRDQLSHLATTVGQLQRDHAALKRELEEAWWRRLATWVKANSSLLRGHV